MKKILNRDCVIYAITTNTHDAWREIVPFNRLLIGKFVSTPYDDMWVKYGLEVNSCAMTHLAYEHKFLYGSYGAGIRTYVIHKDEVEIIKFFEDNAPLHLFTKRKRLNYLEWYFESQNRINDDFEHQMSFHVVSEEYQDMMRKVVKD